MIEAMICVILAPFALVAAGFTVAIGVGIINLLKDKK
jgi:hypothetical protein